VNNLPKAVDMELHPQNKCKRAKKGIGFAYFFLAVVLVLGEL
jgi:hypothetical protein